MAELTEKQLEHNRKCMPIIMEALREGRPWWVVIDGPDGIEDLRGNMDRKALVGVMSSLLESDERFAKVVVEAMMRLSMGHMKQMIDRFSEQEEGGGGEEPKLPDTPPAPEPPV